MADSRRRDSEEPAVSRRQQRGRRKWPALRIRRSTHPREAALHFVVRSQLHTLSLAFPPVSNQEAEWIKKDPGVMAQLADTHIYVVAKRREAFFENFDDPADGTLNFDFKVEGIGDDRATLSLSAIVGDVEFFEVEFGDKGVRVWETNGHEERLGVLDWFSTEKLLWDRSRGHPAVSGLDRFREFLTYELLYVGISKSSDAFKRLVVNPHHKRITILSNERPAEPTSRVSDEVILLFLDIEPLQFRTLEGDEDFDFETPDSMSKDRVVADAEKALVNILQGKYNEIRFKQYPKGSDGLHGTGLTRYAYSINEDLLLTSGTTSIRGCRSRGSVAGNGADLIAIEGDQVQLIQGSDIGS